MREPVTVWGYRTHSGLHSGLRQPSVMSVPGHGEEGATKEATCQHLEIMGATYLQSSQQMGPILSFLEIPSGDAKPRILWEVCRCRHLCLPSGEAGAVEANLLAEKDIRGCGDIPCRITASSEAIPS